MSLTPRGHRSHLPPSTSPSRSSKQAKAKLLPLEKPPATPIRSTNLLTKPSASSSTLLTKPSTSSSFSRNNIRNSNIIRPTPISDSLDTKPSTKLPFRPGGSPLVSVRSNNPTQETTPISNSLDTKPSTKLPFRPGGSPLVPIRSDNNTQETRIIQLERSMNKYDGRGIILPEDEANISIDKLLAQWEEKINKAERQFDEEELAFERSQARLSTPLSRTNSLRSDSPNKSSRLLEKAKRIIGHNQRLSPMKKHHNPLL